MVAAAAVFIVALAVIASERVHRTKVALLGAVIVILIGVVEQEAAIEAIDFNTIGLLAGMMLIVRVTEPTGVYNYLAIRAGQISRGRPLAVVVALAGTTALLSAFLDNLTTVLLMVPITLFLADTLDIPPLPLVIIEIIASNLGGTATLIGDPPNILIAGATQLTFLDFLVNLGPIAVISLVVVTGALYLVYRPRLRSPSDARERVMALDARRSIEDPRELRRSLPVLGLTILAFFAQGALGLEPATIALAGAAVMLLLTRQSVEEALRGIEWPTLFFFIGLFVMVGALEETGGIDRIAQALGSVTGGERSAELLGIAWLSAAGSAVVDNIPFTTTMIPVVEELQVDAGDDAYWWALALGACFGGNATIVAAAANVAAAGMVERAGMRITFFQFLRVGVPVTIGSIALATAYIVLRYV